MFRDVLIWDEVETEMYMCSFYSLHNNIHLQTNVKGLQKFIAKEKTSCNLNKTKKTSVNKSSLKNEIKFSYSRENGATFPSAWEVGHVDNGLLNMATTIADENHLIRSPLLVKIRK